MNKNEETGHALLEILNEYLSGPDRKATRLRAKSLACQRRDLGNIPCIFIFGSRV